MAGQGGGRDRFLESHGGYGLRRVDSKGGKAPPSRNQSPTSSSYLSPSSPYFSFVQMVATTSPEVLLEVFPYLPVLKDGTIDRLAGTQVAHPGLDPETGVLSKDIVILPQTGVSARLYRPITTKPGTKLPIFKPSTQTLFLSFQKTQNPSLISSSQHNPMPFHRHRRGNWPNQATWHLPKQRFRHEN
ncbi:hypothetical protein C1H46_023370 [Malus baccata]|uniref:Uncharacterized protein n=1 Tax=Malus baccata TaxID=106549 RepID=A0A540LXC0_MALBA|nr:hypothetical protein C1H46_023370 [Malus baccata]